MEKLQPQFQITAKLQVFFSKGNPKIPSPKLTASLHLKNGLVGRRDRGPFLPGKLGPIFRGELLFNFEGLCMSKYSGINRIGGGNSNVFYFHPYYGEDEPILTNIFQVG